MRNYYATINNPRRNGAIFIAVMRGKVSEGLDFADMYGRAVIVVGIPLAPCYDQKVILKRNYLDEKVSNENGKLTGWAWYHLDAARAINQSVGRVIRHINDFGAILLCDQRFDEPRYQYNISTWVRNEIRSQNDFQSTTSKLSSFFQRADETLPKPERNLTLDIDNMLDDDEFSTESYLQPSSATNSDTDSSDSSDDDSANDSDATIIIDSDTEDGSGTSSQTNSEDISTESEGSQIITMKKRKKRRNPIIDTDSDSNTDSIIKQNGVRKIYNIGSDSENEPEESYSCLKSMENDLGIDKYQQLSTTCAKYAKDEDYTSYRNSLFELFAEKRWFYALKSMLLFTKNIHRANFEKDIENFTASRTKEDSQVSNEDQALVPTISEQPAECMHLNGLAGCSSQVTIHTRKRKSNENLSPNATVTSDIDVKKKCNISGPIDAHTSSTGL